MARRAASSQIAHGTIAALRGSNASVSKSRSSQATTRIGPHDAPSVTEHADLLSSIGLSISGAAGLAFAAHRPKHAPLLAYLLAGVLIGPQIGLGLVKDQASIHTVSEIGLILLLFIIGLELDFNEVLAPGRPVLIPRLLKVPLSGAPRLACVVRFGLSILAGDL